jgi:hypothetical protein
MILKLVHECLMTVSHYQQLEASNLLVHRVNQALEKKGKNKIHL